jgi:hypothetical protein
MNVDAPVCVTSAFGAHCLSSKASRVHGLGSIFGPPTFQPGSRVYKHKRLELTRSCENVVSTTSSLSLLVTTRIGQHGQQLWFPKKRVWK